MHTTVNTSHICGNNYITIQWIIIFHNYNCIPFFILYQLCSDSKEKKAGPSEFWSHIYAFVFRPWAFLVGMHKLTCGLRYGHVLCGWLWWILQYRYNTDCLAQQWILWIVIDCIHNMFSFTSVKPMNKTINKILLNMSSTSLCPVKHTGTHQHVEQLLHVWKGENKFLMC